MIQPPTIYHQRLPDCFIYPALTAFQILLAKAGLEVWVPSPRFVLACWRKEKLRHQSNFGACKVIEKYGLCREEDYPYDTDLPQKTFYQFPTPELLAKAKPWAGISYRKIDRKQKVIASWLEKGFPVMCLFETSVEALRDAGKCSRHGPPAKKEKKFYHAGAIMHLMNEWATVLNSYGKEWGFYGFVSIPTKYILSGKCQDFYVMDALKKPTK